MNYTTKELDWFYAVWDKYDYYNTGLMQRRYVAEDLSKGKYLQPIHNLRRKFLNTLPRGRMRKNIQF